MNLFNSIGLAQIESPLITYIFPTHEYLRGVLRHFNKGRYQVLLPAYNGLWYLLILKSVV